MRNVIIENPVINSPFREPERHFRFDDWGITNEIVCKRRQSEYFIPIPKSSTSQPQFDFGEGWTVASVREENQVHQRCPRTGFALWRRAWLSRHNPCDPTSVGVLDGSRTGEAVFLLPDRSY